MLLCCILWCEVWTERIARKENEFVRRFDDAAMKDIVNELLTARNIGIGISDDVIETILRKPTFRQPFAPGHLYLCPIEKASSVLRDSLYICGLSAASYPGTPKENPLLLDFDQRAVIVFVAFGRLCLQAAKHLPCRRILSGLYPDGHRVDEETYQAADIDAGIVAA